MNKYFSNTDIIVIAVTAVLFGLAIFAKGITKDLLLEAGVLLVSVKLILMMHKTAVANEKMLNELQDIKEQISDSKIK